MHDCWLVAELTQAIFGELREHDHLQSADETTGGSSKSVPGACLICLSRLALVCRQFHEPALDLLWEKQSELDNLLKCLPSHAWISTHKYGIIIQSPINQQARDRLSFYAKRVRTFQTTRGGVLHESVPETLSIWGTRGHLLPNVRHVICATASPLFPILPQLVGSAVTEIKIRLLNGPVRRLMALASIATQCPDLSVVGIGVVSNEAKEWVSGFILSLMRLRSLDIAEWTNMPETTFRCLLDLRSLQKLQINLSPLRITPRLRNNLMVGFEAFTGLRALSFSAMTVEIALRLVELVWTAPLKTLLIQVTHWQTFRGASIQMLCLKIVSEQRIADLTSICLFFLALPPNAMSKITGNMILPLLSLRHLRRVDLRFPSDPALDDRFFELLAWSWPSLQTLSIQGLDALETESASASYPSILCLIPLSRGCPDLRAMKLSLDATVVPLHTGSRLPRTIQTVLKTWDVSHSPIASAHDVAAFISSIFPSLSIAASQENGHKAAWTNTQSLLSAYTSIREDERSMLGSNSAGS